MADNPTSDFLISGKDYLAKQPGFKLVGRKEELNAALDVLNKKHPNNNLVLYSRGGTGLSSLVAGLQVGDDETGAKAPLANKTFYYLDVDALFSSGDSTKIKEGFQRTIKTLQDATNPVLVVENTNGFLDGMSNNSAVSLMNVLMRELRTNENFQTIFMAANSDVATLLKAHEDIDKNFGLQAVEEPSKEELRPIIEQAAGLLGKSYGVTVSKEAIDTVMELTKKYPLSGFSQQPKRSLMILEGAITAALRTTSTATLAPGQAKLEKTLEAVMDALASGKPSAGELAGMSENELNALRVATESDLDELKQAWAEKQEKLDDALLEINDATQAIREIDAAIEEQKRTDDYNEKTRQDALKKYAEAEGNKDTQDSVKAKYLEVTGETLIIPNGKDAKSAFDKLTTGSSSSSSAVNELNKERREQDKILKDNKKIYDDLMQEIDKAREAAGEKAEVSLTETQVLSEFSRLSNIPVNKLNQDEAQKVLHIADTIKKRVFGQDAPAEALQDAIITAKAGLKPPRKPIGNFLFLGPSGVGKTEMAKALAEALFDDERALESYSMSEYQEKQNISVLIGAAPGLEGNRDGGRLTNKMIAKPYTVNLFDEIEKAHKDIFDIFLQIFDEGELTDTRGQTASFANSVNIMTSNIGSEFFLDETISFKEATKRALAKLKDPKTGFRPEFLNRFNGIYAFNRLGQPEIIRIAHKNLDAVNEMSADKNIHISMPDEDIVAMAAQQYDPTTGGRGIQNYIGAKITKDAGKAILLNPGVEGVVEVHYEPGKASEADIAAIRKEVEEEGFVDIYESVQADLKNRLAVKYAGDAKATEKIDADIAAETKKRIEEEITKKIKELERETAVASTKFVSGAAAQLAAQVAANQNKKPQAAPQPKTAAPAAK